MGLGTTSLVIAGLALLCAYGVYSSRFVQDIVNRDAALASVLSLLLPVSFIPFHIKSAIGRTFPSIDHAEGALWSYAGRHFLRPSHNFDVSRVPPAPDYTDARSWYAQAHFEDGSDTHCDILGTSAHDDELKADAFYLHPTTFYLCDEWNAPFDSASPSLIVADALLVQQGTCFNNVAHIYAPKIRQMCAAGYFDEENGAQAIEVAYQDVLRAFRQFLLIRSAHSDGTTPTRPYFLKGHSQGSQLLQMLLEREIIPSATLRSSLVAAYLVGSQIHTGLYTAPDSPVPVCDAPDQTHCLISWRTYQSNGGNPRSFMWRSPPPSESSVCVNPLSWRAHDTSKVTALNLGSMYINHPQQNFLHLLGIPRSQRIREGVSPLTEPWTLTAQCIDGHLYIDTPPLFTLTSELGRVWGLFPNWEFAKFPGLSYHAYDWNLFYANARENAKVRLTAFLGRRKEEK